MEAKKIISIEKLRALNNLNESLQQETTDLSRYKKDYKYFVEYAESIGAAVNGETLVLYLHHLLKERGFKKNTFNRRYFACKKILSLEGIELTNDEIEMVKQLREHYKLEEHAKQAKTTGKQPVDPDELLALIDNIEDVRIKAILYVQYFTGNRPSEMVRLQVSHFDLDNGLVDVHLKKQKEIKTKRLPLTCVNAVRTYFKKYKLKDEHYFVGAEDRHKNYTSRQVTLSAYSQLIDRASKLTPYVYRKTLVKRLFSNGAPLETIRKQTGHASVRTISEHYLQVDVTEVDKYF